MVEMRSSGKNVLKTLEGRKRRFLKWQRRGFRNRTMSKVRESERNLMGTGAGVMEIETSCI
jgi:hypothetical protein